LETRVLKITPFYLLIFKTNLIMMKYLFCALAFIGMIACQQTKSVKVVEDPTEIVEDTVLCDSIDMCIQDSL
jgi:phosphatidylglycerophosphatase A